jgi:hypothetical protein
MYTLPANFEIPFTKFRKRLYFSKKELDEWIIKKARHPKESFAMALSRLKMNIWFLSSPCFKFIGFEF